MLTVGREGNIYKIVDTLGFRLPKDLEGLFTSEALAMKTIREFQAKVRSRAKPVGKAKKRLQNAKR